MARNRGRTGRDGKREAIVEAAAQLFRERGVEGSSMAAIAEAAGITKNTVYWYFDDKDALLLGVLSAAVRAMRESWATVAPEDLARRLQGLVEAFAGIEHLTAALHARARVSDSAREWHERFHRRSDLWLQEQIETFLEREGLQVSPGTTATVARLWALGIDAMVSHGVSDGERVAVCELLVEQLRGSASPLGDARPSTTAAAAPR